MREILFRGKRVDNGEWVEGSFCMDAIEQLFGCKTGMDGFIRRFNPDIHKSNMFEVDRETVGQFTGLEDQLGTKIFEGDVIDDLGVEYIVVFDSDYAQFRGRFDGWNAEISHIASRCEVIGNIYDNPELLEVSGNE